MRETGKVRLKEVLKLVLAVTLPTLFFGGALEVGLRLLNIPDAPVFGWQWDRSPYKSEENMGEARVNQLGLRGRPIEYKADDFVILLVGDSYTEAGAQAFEDMPEQILEGLLRRKYGFDHVRVFSVASAGWGQDQELIGLMNYFARFRADLVLMWLTPINDYWENGNVDRSVAAKSGPLKPTFKINKNNLELAYPRQQSKIGLLIERAFARLKYGKENGLAQLYTEGWLKTLPEPKLEPTSKTSCPPTEVEQLEIVSAYQKGERNITAITNEDLTQARSHFSHFLVPASARENYQLSLTHMLMKEARKLAESHGASFRAFYPKGSDIDVALSAVKCVKDESTGKYFSSDFSNLVADIEKSDLGGVLLTPDVRSKNPTVISSRDWHLNHDGNLLAMDGLIQKLRDQNLLPPIPAH